MNDTHSTSHLEISPGLVVKPGTPRLPLSGYKLIAFDMDSTLINIECVDEIADAVGRKAEVAKQLEWTVAQVRDISESVVQVHSLEQIVGSKGEADTELQDLLPDDKVMRPEEQVDGDLLKEDIASALDMLSPWEASILRMRFGFLDGEIHPLSDLARKFGLSREGMRQVANRAMEKIRQSRHADGLKEYMSN